MEKLVVKLRQHTPLLHFQNWQEGATLRASEVKPKLDRFLIDMSGGKDKINPGWLVGNGEHQALDYKMRIEAGDRQGIQMGVFRNDRGKWITRPFPSVLSNMGGKTTREELVNFSMCKDITLTITCFKENGLYELLRDNLALFFARHNFGQRSSKGFGSFTVARIGSEVIKTEQYFEDVLLFMDYKVDEGARPYATQRTVMGIIEIFWKKVKKSTKEDHGIVVGRGRRITTIEQYVKEMATFRPDGDSRMPSPVFFKPVRYKGKYRIYIMPDIAMLKRIDNESEDKRNIRIQDKEDVAFIDENIIGYADEPGKLGVNYDTGEWQIKVDEDKVVVQF